MFLIHKKYFHPKIILHFLDSKKSKERKRTEKML
jgi:hypothetical protein